MGAVSIFLISLVIYSFNNGTLFSPNVSDKSTFGKIDRFMRNPIASVVAGVYDNFSNKDDVATKVEPTATQCAAYVTLNVQYYNNLFATLNNNIPPEFNNLIKIHTITAGLYTEIANVSNSELYLEVDRLAIRYGIDVQGASIKSHNSLDADNFIKMNS